MTQTQAKLEKRQGALARLLRKLFEDNSTGLVNDENYAIMFNAYQDEQAEVMGKLQSLQAKLAKEDDYRANAQKLRDVIREHLDIHELTPFVLNKLVERIETGHIEMVDGKRRQKIVLIWRFAGSV